MSTPAAMKSSPQENSGAPATGAAPTGTPVTVAVVEDSPIMRRNLSWWLGSTPGFQCICTCADGHEALRVIPDHRPQVVLMDIQMPGMSGVDCTARLKQLLPALQIIVLTVYEDTDTIFEALRAGACGYLLKRSSPEQILNAIRDILQGGAPMTNAIARKLVTAFQTPVEPVGPATTLSLREREVLDLLARGLSNKEIGAKLNLSPFTVKNYLARVFEKLHVRCRTEAVMAYLHPEPKLGAQRPGPGAP